jgi:hypothetical protein
MSCNITNLIKDCPFCNVTLTKNECYSFTNYICNNNNCRRLAFNEVKNEYYSATIYIIDYNIKYRITLGQNDVNIEFEENEVNIDGNYLFYLDWNNLEYSVKHLIDRLINLTSYL